MMDAYAKSRTPKTDRDKRSTPRWVYRAICEAIGMTPMFDVCAEDHTAVAADYWTEQDDALLIDWGVQIRIELSGMAGSLPVAWMNCPYSNPGAWCDKAQREAAKGMIVVGLLPDDRSVGWYQKYIHGVAPTVFLTPARIPFVMPATGEEQPGNPKGSIIPIWTPWRTGHTQETYIPTEIWTRHKQQRGVQ